MACLDERGSPHLTASRSSAPGGGGRRAILLPPQGEERVSAEGACEAYDNSTAGEQACQHSQTVSPSLKSSWSQRVRFERWTLIRRPAPPGVRISTS